MTLCLAAATSAQAIDDAAFAAQCDAIRPSVEETSWRAVPWQTELRQALIAADKEQRPVLLWAMNGHPLGQC